MSTIVTMSWLTLHKALRRRMVLVALILGALFLVLFSTGFYFIQKELIEDSVRPLLRDNVYNFLLLAGLYVVHFLTIMMSIFSSIDTISGKIASHTIHVIATKPLRHWQIVLGKWIGFSIMIGTYVLLLSGGISLIVYVMAGYVPPSPHIGMLLLLTETIVLLSLSLAGGAIFSTMTNGVALFMLYGLAFIGSWVEQIGSLLNSSNAVRVGIVTSLFLPVEALWRRAAYLMQPKLIQELGLSPFATSSVPSQSMVIYAVVYSGVALCIAMYLFTQRDL